MSQSVPPPGAGLASTAVTVFGSVLKLARVRFSIAMMEFSDARDAFLRVFLLSFVALIASAFVLLSLSAMIVALAWDALGWRILLILSLGYLMLAISMFWTARRIIASGQIGLPVTLAELKKDRAALFDERDETNHSA